MARKKNKRRSAKRTRRSAERAKSFASFSGNMESLEKRELLTVNLLGSESADTFTVTGNDAGLGNDRQQTLTQAIDIDGLGGNDVVKLTSDVSNSASINVDGGAGRDTLDFSKMDGNINLSFDHVEGIEDLDVGGHNFIDVSNIEVIKGGTGENTLDLGGYAGPLTVTIQKGSGSAENSVVVKTAADVELITFSNVNNIEGSNGNTTFVFEKGAQLDGEIDGNAGTNTLNYASFGASVTSTLPAAGVAVAGVTRPLPTDGIKNITHIIGGSASSSFLGGAPRGNDLRGNAANNTLTGGKHDDFLGGGDGIDALTGGEGEDELDGGSGADALSGGPGSDTYIYELTDFHDPIVAADQDTITEPSDTNGAQKGDKDVLDLSRIPATDGLEDIELSFDIGMTVDKAGIVAKLDRTLGVAGTLFNHGPGGVENLEKIIVGAGVSKVNFGASHDWSKKFEVATPQTTSNVGTVDLDFSNFAEDLVFKISADSSVIVYRAQANDEGGLKPATKINGANVRPISVERVRHLTGGKGNNTFVMGDKAKLLPNGILTGDPAGQPDGKINVIDYSNYGLKVEANLTANQVNFTTDIIQPAKTTAGETLPVQEKWKFTAQGLAGNFHFGEDANGDPILAAFRNESANGPNGKALNDAQKEIVRLQDVQFVKDALIKVLKRSDFRLKKIPTGTNTEWRLLFSEPEPVTKPGSPTPPAAGDLLLDNALTLTLAQPAALGWGTVDKAVAVSSTDADGIAKQLVSLPGIKSVTVSHVADEEYNVQYTTDTANLNAAPKLKLLVSGGPTLTDRVINPGDTSIASQVIDLASATGTFQIGFGEITVDPMTKVVAGETAKDASFEVYTNATSGKLKLTGSFDGQNLTGVSSFSFEAEISVNEKPQDIKQKFQASIDSQVLEATSNGTKVKDGVELDVKPKVLVTGLGTGDLPWRITFANMGPTTLVASAPANAVDNLKAVPANIPANSITGFEASGIKSIIGSGVEDGRIYGDDLAAVNLPLSTFKGVGATNGTANQPAAILQDKHTLKLLTSNQLDLKTGKAILYKVTDAKRSLTGLTHGHVYFVSVEQKLQTPGPGWETKVRFYLNQEESLKTGNALEIGDPMADADTTTHTLASVRLASGGSEPDTVIGNLTNESSALLGGAGGDVLVGGDGSDFLSGGKGDDELYTDGRYDSAKPNRSDYVSGGDGNDSIYGFNGPNHLIGGDGNDNIFSGSGDVVEGGSGDDTITLLNGSVGAYDVLDGGTGNDAYRLQGTWGVASIKEGGSRLPSRRGLNNALNVLPGISYQHGDIIDLSDTSQNYVHILSNGNLYSAPGSLDNNEITYADNTTLKLGTDLESLKGTTSSPGQIVTQWGFGFHQSNKGTKAVTGGAALGALNNAELIAYGTPDSPTATVSYEAFTFLLRVDRGSGGIDYSVALPGGNYTLEQSKNVLARAVYKAVFNADAPGVATAELGSTEAQKLEQVGLSVDLSTNILDGHLPSTKFLRIVATPNGALDNGTFGAFHKVIPASLELTVNKPNTVVAGGDNFEELEDIKLGDGANTFVFGNDYWGGGSDALSVAQAIPLVDAVARNLQGELRIDTQDLLVEESPLVLDFRAVNHELRFNFSPVKGNDDVVQLTVSKVRDYNLPLYDLGPNIRDSEIVFTHVDKRAIIYGGRYKNTFNFDKGATYQGKLIGGEGGRIGGLVTLPGYPAFPGRLTDQARETLGLVEGIMFDLNVDAASDAFFQVENVISYSNPGSGITTGGAAALNPLTYVNLQDLKESSGGKATTKDTLAGGALFGVDLAGRAIDLAADKFGWTTTGISGNTENTKDAGLGDVIVRSGINLVRGTDYTPTLDQSAADPFAFIGSGADNISIGDNIFSVTPGLHVLAGGTGADTYSVNSQYFGIALMLDDVISVDVEAGSVGNAVIDAILPQDTVDFSKMYQDLYHTVFSLNTNDIQGADTLLSESGIGVGFPIEIGSTVVVTTGFNPFGETSSGDISLTNLLTKASQFPLGQGNIAIALGVENIVGSRGKNTVTFYDGASIGGRIAPGFGGGLSLNYKEYHGPVNGDSDGVFLDLDASGIDTTIVPSFSDALGLPDWAENLGDDVKYQFGEASGVGGGKLGVVEGGIVVGTDHDDLIHGNKNDNEFDGGDGHDQLQSDDGADILVGGAGNDWLSGGADQDELAGDAGHDILLAGDGDDIIEGGTGNDLLITGSGSDVISPGDGDDDIIGTAGDTYYVNSTENLLVAAHFDLNTTTPDLTVADAVLQVPDFATTAPLHRTFRQSIHHNGLTTFDLTLGHQTKTIALSDPVVPATDLIAPLEELADVVGARLISGNGSEAAPWVIEYDRSINSSAHRTAVGIDKSVTLAARDTFSGVTNVVITKGVVIEKENEDKKEIDFNLPTDAVLLLHDGVAQTVSVNPTGFQQGTYHLSFDSDDNLDIKGWGSARADLGTYSEVADTQTLTFYPTIADKTATTNSLLTLNVEGLGKELTEKDLNLVREEPFTATAAGTGGDNITNAEISAVFRTSVVNRWTALTNNDTEIQDRLVEYTILVQDLPGLALAHTSANTIVFDVNAAGHGWFIDPSPSVSNEFASGVANPGSAAEGKYDLVTVMLHEFGHAIGLTHATASGELMSSTLEVGTRLDATLTGTQADDLPTAPHGGFLVANLSDQEKFETGLNAFGTWTSNFSTKISNMLAGGIDLPFIDVGLDELWATSGGVIADGITDGITNKILPIFESGPQVTAGDLLALDEVSPSGSGRLSEFQAEFEITSTATDLQLDLEILNGLGIDLTDFAELTAVRATSRRSDVRRTIRFRTRFIRQLFH